MTACGRLSAAPNSTRSQAQGGMDRSALRGGEVRLRNGCGIRLAFMSSLLSVIIWITPPIRTRVFPVSPSNSDAPPCCRQFSFDEIPNHRLPLPSSVVVFRRLYAYGLDRRCDVGGTCRTVFLTRKSCRYFPGNGVETRSRLAQWRACTFSGVGCRRLHSLERMGMKAKTGRSELV